MFVPYAFRTLFKQADRDQTLSFWQLEMKSTESAVIYVVSLLVVRNTLAFSLFVDTNTKMNMIQIAPNVWRDLNRYFPASLASL